ncbi:glycoside hydrolase N-terminal domain-containing protein [Streptomyces sp. NPDC059679]|uniref:glycoside hydrolase N-terminal domain-containing protein n=1 Tax=Streptomyces sp. NPDC059679 TaxID=3346903 RepID=UPI0036AEEC2E
MHSAHPPEGGTAAPRPAKVALPDRGIHDTAPAQLWTDGFLTGNGEYGAVVYGDPALEKVVFNHHRLVLPNGTRDLAPPIFVSRADRVIVHELAPAPGHIVDVTLSVHTALDDTSIVHSGGDDLHTRMTFTTLADVGDGSGWLNLRAVYPESTGAYGYEGVTRVVPAGGTVAVSGSTIVVTGASRLTLVTRLDRYDTPADTNVNLQVACGNILDLAEAMQGYFDLILGQLDHWRTNARNLYGARGLLAPSRSDGEYGHMLHFNGGDFPATAGPVAPTGCSTRSWSTTRSPATRPSCATSSLPL